MPTVTGTSTGEIVADERSDSAKLTKGARRAIIILLFLVLIMGFAALLSSYLEWYSYKNSQQTQGQILEQKLCTTLDRLASLKPPAGSPANNPSRQYEQDLAKLLAQLKPDVGCKA